MSDHLAAPSGIETAAVPIDLTAQHPRSPRAMLDGIKILPRAIDKARAQLAGTLGHYIYFMCGVNRVLFTTLHVTEQQFLDAVAASPDDAGVVRWIREVVKPDPARIAMMNERIEHMKPETPQAKAVFEVDLAATGTTRTDITTYADLLDLEEGRLPLHAP